MEHRTIQLLHSYNDLAYIEQPSVDTTTLSVICLNHCFEVHFLTTRTKPPACVDQIHLGNLHKQKVLQSAVRSLCYSMFISQLYALSFSPILLPGSTTTKCGFPIFNALAINRAWFPSLPIV